MYCTEVHLTPVIPKLSILQIKIVEKMAKNVESSTQFWKTVFFCVPHKESIYCVLIVSVVSDVDTTVAMVIRGQTHFSPK
jgi:hypothetical protein